MIINSRVCLVGPIKIGKDAVINTGSVVTRDVAPYTIVEGSPAKKIGFVNNENSRTYNLS